LTTRTELSSFSRTKLYRPPAADDYVCREYLEARLGGVETQPIIVVSAPAGYGKTTMISHWIDQSAAPCAWLSLDTHDNDLRLFLHYLAAAFSEWCPPAARSLKKIIESQELPAPSRAAEACVSEIDQVEDSLVLVLDDYHSIREIEIHEFVSALLNHMPACLRVAIVSRRRPPLSLSRLRSQNLVIDIGLQDLQFNDQDTRALVSSTTSTTIDDQTLSKLHAVTEGWPVGLRMVLLALSGKQDMQAFLDRFEGSLWQIQEYLVEEVVRQLPDEIADCIYRTSVLDRFSADLCDATISAEGVDVPSGQDIVNFIRDKNLFCIPLDEKQEWYRYHHLFQELLITKCKSLHTRKEIQDLHLRAAKWFDRYGDVEESIRHSLKADDLELATDIVAHHGRRLNDGHESHRLDRLLEMLPAKQIEGNVSLTLLRGWNSNRLGRITQMKDATQLAEKLFHQIGTGENGGDIQLGEICAIRSMIEGFFGDNETALTSARKALEILPANFVFERTEAVMLEAMSLQMLGDNAAARNTLYQAIERSGSETARIRSRVMIAMCYVNWMNGDLNDLQYHSKSLLELGQSTNLSYSIVHACWFNGAAQYQLNDLNAATNIVQIVTAKRWWPHQRSYSNCIQIMSLIYAARGEHSLAFELSEALVQESLERSSTYFLPDAQALQAELAYARGDYATATRWAFDYEMGPPTAGFGFCEPALIAARILLNVESEDEQKKADSILREYEAFYESSHNERFLIETLALRAMHCAISGDENGAEQLLAKAVILAQPNGFVRLFIDLGPNIVALLNRLDLTEQQLEYVGTILAGFQGVDVQQRDGNAMDDSNRRMADLPQALSKREREVLELLAKRLTNKEIGERLFIAPETVKRHAHNIFEKLNVGSRGEARAKATGLGLVSG